MYKKESFSDEQIQHLGWSFAAALKHIVHFQDSPVSDVALISPADLDQILRKNQEVPMTHKSCIHVLFGQQAALRPDAMAVDSHDGHILYRDLDRLSSLLKVVLLEKLPTLGPGKLLSIGLMKSKWVIIVILAALKIGAGIILVDYTQSEGRLRRILNLTAPEALIYQDETSAPFLDLGEQVQLINLGSLKDLGPVRKIPSEDNRFSPSNTSFIVPTSGSTGDPKLIVHDHCSISSVLLHVATAANISAGSRVLQFASYAFDASIFEMLAPLIHGGCVCIPSEQDRLRDTSTFVRSKQVNWALLTPSFAETLSPDEFHPLKTLAIGGEALTRSLIERWGSSLQLLTMYGPAEGIICTVGEARLANPSYVRRVWIP